MTTKDTRDLTPTEHQSTISRKVVDWARSALGSVRLEGIDTSKVSPQEVVDNFSESMSSGEAGEQIAAARARARVGLKPS